MLFKAHCFPSTSAISTLFLWCQPLSTAQRKASMAHHGHSPKHAQCLKAAGCFSGWRERSTYMKVCSQLSVQQVISRYKNILMLPNSCLQWPSSHPQPTSLIPFKLSWRSKRIYAVSWEEPLHTLHLLNMLKIPADSYISTNDEKHGEEVNLKAGRTKSWGTAAAVLQQRSAPSQCCLLLLFKGFTLPSLLTSHWEIPTDWEHQSKKQESQTQFLHSWGKFHWRVENMLAAIH